MNRLNLSIALAFTLLLSACTVGPNYKRPDVPTAPSFRGSDGVPTATAASIADEKWWDLFKDPQLQELIRTALKQNYDLRIAATRVLQERQQITITRANQFPNVTAGPQFTGVRSPAIAGVFPAYAYLADELGASGSWDVDFWGKYRRASEAARANYASSQWAQKAVISSLVEDLATDYLELREFDYELDIEKQTLEARQQSLKLTQTLEQGGNTTLIDVRQAQQLVEEAAGSIPQTEQAIQQEENAIKLLLGESPGPITRGQNILEQPNPEELPVGLPSQLLERRPDIQEAEQNLIAANAEIGVARAQLFPTISLTGTGGLESIGLGNLFAWGARAYQFTTAGSQPIFNAGSLRANVRLSEAQKQQAVLTYQQAIQTAFEEVSNSLIAKKKLTEYRVHEEALTEAAKGASDLAKIRYKGGVTTYLEVLTNDTNYFSAELTLARARLSERLSLVQLYNALGGGWQQ